MEGGDVVSERYGAPGELQEVLEGLEDHVREQIDETVAQMRQREPIALGDGLFDAGRLMALRDVLDYLGVSNP